MLFEAGFYNFCVFRQASVSKIYTGLTIYLALKPQYIFFDVSAFCSYK